MAAFDAVDLDDGFDLVTFALRFDTTEVDIVAAPALPTVAIVSPTVGSTLLSNTPLVVDIQVPTTSAILFIQVDIQYSGSSNVSENAFTGIVLNASGFAISYSANSSITQLSTTHYQLSIVRNQGWLRNNPSVTVLVFDKSGQSTSSTFAWIYPPPVTVLITRSVDARAVQVLFNTQPNLDDALNPANYSISPTLSVTGVTQLGSNLFVLTTSRQTTGVTYTATVTGIRSA